MSDTKTETTDAKTPATEKGPFKQTFTKTIEVSGPIKLTFTEVTDSSHVPPAKTGGCGCGGHKDAVNPDAIVTQVLNGIVQFAPQFAEIIANAIGDREA